jgi:hypothetical protein
MEGLGRRKDKVLPVRRRMGEWMCTSTLAGDEWSALRPGRFIPDTHWIGGWVDLSVGLDAMEKRKFLTLPGHDLRLLGRPARS